MDRRLRLRISSIVSGFARHVANIEPKTEVPPAGILPGLRRAMPHVYSDVPRPPRPRSIAAEPGRRAGPFVTSMNDAPVRWALRRICATHKVNDGDTSYQ
jgi:hypothetical protein